MNSSPTAGDRPIDGTTADVTASSMITAQSESFGSLNESQCENDVGPPKPFKIKSFTISFAPLFCSLKIDHYVFSTAHIRQPAETGSVRKQKYL